MSLAPPSLHGLVKVKELSNTNLIPTLSASASLPQGRDITVTCQSYADRLLVSVTQYGKMGCLIQAQTHIGSSYAEPVPWQDDAPSSAPLQPTVSLVPLFGTPPPELQDVYSLYATHIATRISQDLIGPSADLPSQSRLKPIIVALALERSPTKEEWDMSTERVRLDQVMQLLAQCRVW